MFTDMNEKPEMPTTTGTGFLKSSTTATDNPAAGSTVLEDEGSTKKDFDPRLYRPLDVVVSITMHDIQAHLVKVCIFKII